MLILLAMPSVLRLMEKAKKNAFYTEYNSIQKICETAYVDYSLQYDFSDYEQIWIPLYVLKREGYTEKNFNEPDPNRDNFHNGECIFISNGEQYKTLLLYSDGTKALLTIDADLKYIDVSKYNEDMFLDTNDMLQRLNYCKNNSCGLSEAITVAFFGACFTKLGFDELEGNDSVLLIQ